MFLPDRMYKNKAGEQLYVLYNFPESPWPIIALDSRKRFQKFKKDGRFLEQPTEKDLVDESNV